MWGQVQRPVWTFGIKILVGYVSLVVNRCEIQKGGIHKSRRWFWLPRALELACGLRWVRGSEASSGGRETGVSERELAPETQETRALLSDHHPPGGRA